MVRTRQTPVGGAFGGRQGGPGRSAAASHAYGALQASFAASFRKRGWIAPLRRAGAVDRRDDRGPARKEEERNSARQAEITQEISEIVGGANALAAAGSEE